MRVFNIMMMKRMIITRIARVNTDLSWPATSATNNLEKII